MISMINGVDYKFKSWCEVTIPTEAVFGKDIEEYDLEKFTKNSNGEYTLTHDNGWTISSKPRYDYYVWIDSFKASHPIYGKVWSDNLNVSINGDNAESLRIFLKIFPLEEFDSGDI